MYNGAKSKIEDLEMATKINPETGKREKTGGRKPGSQNKTTTQLKEAILQAAEEVGDELAIEENDPMGLDGLPRYLKLLATKHHQAFSTLLGKVLPSQLAMEVPEGAEYKWNFEVVPKNKSDDTAESTNPVH